MRGRATHQTHMAAAREAARHQGHSVCAFGLVDTCRFLPIVYILTQWLVFQYFEFFYSNLCNKINPTKILVLNYIVNCSVIKDLNCLIFNTFKHFTAVADFFFFIVSLYRKKKEDDRQKDDTQPETAKDKLWKMMDDVQLQHLVKEAKESILLLSDEREQYAALAR